MPALEISDLAQRAVLWPFTGYDRWGKVTVGEPVEIPCRWLTVRKEAQDTKGNIVTLNAQAFVDRDIYPGSHMWLGTLKDWEKVAGDPETVDEELMSVINFPSTPDVKGRNARKSVGLMRYHDVTVNE